MSEAGRSAVLIQRTPRSGAEPGSSGISRCGSFWPASITAGRQTDDNSLAGLVFSWLARRGATTTRLDPHHWESVSAFRARVGHAPPRRQLFLERLVIV